MEEILYEIMAWLRIFSIVVILKLKNNFITNVSKYIKYNPVNILLYCGLLIFICYYIVPIYLFSIESSKDKFVESSLSIVVMLIFCGCLMAWWDVYYKKNEINYFHYCILLTLLILLTIITNFVILY